MNALIARLNFLHLYGFVYFDDEGILVVCNNLAHLLLEVICADEVHQGGVQLLRNYPCLGGEYASDGLIVLVLVLGTDVVEVDEGLHDPSCWI